MKHLFNKSLYELYSEWTYHMILVITDLVTYIKTFTSNTHSLRELINIFVKEKRSLYCGFTFLFIFLFINIL